MALLSHAPRNSPGALASASAAGGSAATARAALYGIATTMSMSSRAPRPEVGCTVSGVKLMLGTRLLTTIAYQTSIGPRRASADVRPIRWTPAWAIQTSDVHTITTSDPQHKVICAPHRAPRSRGTAHRSRCLPHPTLKQRRQAVTWHRTARRVSEWRATSWTLDRADTRRPRTTWRRQATARLACTAGSWAAPSRSARGIALSTTSADP